MWRIDLRSDMFPWSEGGHLWIGVVWQYIQFVLGSVPNSAGVAVRLIFSFGKRLLSNLHMPSLWIASP